MRISIKSIAFIAILANVSTSAHSGSDDCSMDIEFANVFMTHRQDGLWSLETMMQKFGSEPGLRAMILDAYDKPRMNTAETRSYLIDEFSNAWGIRCFRDGSVFDPSWAQ